MYQISIIIPMHNVEKYLPKAINSVIKQTIGFQNIELILVDDASTDTTSSISKDFCKLYNNIKYIHLPQTSGSAGHPRNIGIEFVTSDYIMYMDADDLLDSEACKTLYKKCIETNADCIIANYKNMDEDGTIWDTPQFDLQKYTDFKIDINHNYQKSLFVLESAVWNKIYKTSFIKDNNLRFLEGVPAEDAYFCLSSFLTSSNLYYTNSIIYYYRLRNKNNLSVSNNCKLDFFKKYNEGYQKIYNMFQNYPNNSELKRFFFTKAILFMIYKFIDSELMTDEEKIQVFELMHWFYSLTKTHQVIITEPYISMIIDSIIEKEYDKAITLCNFMRELRKDLPKEINANMSEQNDTKYIRILNQKNH